LVLPLPSPARGNLLLFQEVRCWISNLLPPFLFEQTAIFLRQGMIQTKTADTKT
jgi:hypothetical protein